jgi:hypothetical protein
MDENNIDEKLITWDTILNEIRLDTDLMIHDLLSGIAYVGASGVLVIILGLYVLFVGLKYGNTQDPMFIIMLAVATIPSFFVGFINLNRYVQLRARYIRLSDLQAKLKK